VSAVDGSAELRELGRRLKAAGETGIKRELFRSLRKAAYPLIPAARENARARLPKAGGLNERVADSDMGTQIRTTGKSVGVRVRTKTHDTRATNNGYVRHPVFGTWRDNVPSQQIPGAKNWWTDAMKEKTPEARAEVETVLLKVAAQLDVKGIL
jgi:hypothetical protein